MAQSEQAAAEFWRSWFSSEGYAREKRLHRLLKVLPSSPRCKFCGAPFRGIGASAVRLALGKRPSNANARYCNVCDEFGRKNPGGAEVEMSMLFADVRDSTGLSERMTAKEFSQLINRFYVESTRVLMQADALIDKLAGDSVAAFWGAGFAGPEYVARTIESAKELLLSTGHADPKGPWIPVGIGVHHGTAFFGSMGTPDGLTDMTAVGDEVNLAARLGASAGTGEIVVSLKALQAAGLQATMGETRELQLRGLTDTVAARVLRVA